MRVSEIVIGRNLLNVEILGESYYGEFSECIIEEQFEFIKGNLTDEYEKNFVNNADGLIFNKGSEGYCFFDVYNLNNYSKKLRIVLKGYSIEGTYWI